MLRPPWCPRLVSGTSLRSGGRGILSQRLTPHALRVSKSPHLQVSMPSVRKPPPELLFHTYQGVELYLFDATRGHRREGWNHHQDKYCLVQCDPVLPHKDFGVVGDDLDTLLLETKQVIDRRKKVHLNVMDEGLRTPASDTTTKPL